MSKKLAIIQSNYIPWKGYFDIIRAMDEFVILDDVQYTKRDWRNRNQIKTPDGLRWLSIPVVTSGLYQQAIRDTKVSHQEWRKEHWLTIKHNYGKAPYFTDYADQISDLYLNHDDDNLTIINQQFILTICHILNIQTPITDSSTYTTSNDKNKRLVDICKQAGATDYYSGPAAKGYLDIDLFNVEGINVHFVDYSNYPEYPQIHPPFIHSVTVLDLIFNTGQSATQYMKDLAL